MVGSEIEAKGIHFRRVSETDPSAYSFEGQRIRPRANLTIFHSQRSANEMATKDSDSASLGHPFWKHGDTPILRFRQRLSLVALWLALAT